MTSAARTAFAALLYLAAAPGADAAEPLRGIGCAIDGDSILLDGPRDARGRCLAEGAAAGEIRLHGIDAPELKQTCRRDGADWPCGEAAAAALARLVGGRLVVCRVRATDRYGRRIAQCEADGQDIEREMVRQGLAVAYRRYSADYAVDEDAARVARRGIWAGTFIPPERWRHQNRP